MSKQFGICPNCNKQFSYYPHPSKKPKKYCSRKCQSEHARITTTCPKCGKEFWYHKSWPRIYCSRKCSAAVNAKANLGIIELPQMFCEICGQEINKKWAGRRFCSRKCFAEHLCKTRTGIPRPEIAGEKPHLQKRVNKVCPQCGVSFQVKESHSRRRRYCSKRCMATAGQVQRICEFCGVAFVTKRSLTKGKGGKFCSKHCHIEHQKTLRGPQTNNWRGGHPPYYGPNWIEQRDKARKRDNYTCQDCGITESELSRALDVHHIKPFRVFGIKHYKEANHLDNLISYCRECHAKREPRLRDSLTGQFALPC